MQDAATLRDYLVKGGFLWVDDFWGPCAWDNWVSNISKVLPPGEYPIHDIPLDHPIRRMLFEFKDLPQIRRSISGISPAARPRSASS